VKTIPQPRTYATNAHRQAAYRQRTATATEAHLAAKGLPALPAPANVPGTTRWRALLTQARFALTTVEAEMQTYYDARSSSWQESEKGETFQEKAQAVAELGAELDQLQNEYFP